MKTLKEYKDEYKIAEEEASKIILWHDLNSLTDLINRIEELCHDVIENRLKQENNFSIGKGKLFENREDYLENYKSAYLFYWLRQFDNRIDLQLKYTNELKLLIENLEIENKYIFITRYQVGLKAILSEFFRVFTNSVFFSITENGVKLYFGVQTEEQFKISKQFLITRMNLEFALCGENMSNIINKDYNNFSRLSSDKINNLFSYIANIDYKDRNYFFKNNEKNSFYNTILFHTQPIIKMIERIKLPPSPPNITDRPFHTKQQELSLREIALLYYYNGKPLNSSIANEIAGLYGMKSGSKIMEHYLDIKNGNNIFHHKNAVKNIEKILPLIDDVRAKEKAQIDLIRARKK